ncbi:MAG TPA: response regulator [Acidimicrobiia bacterium]|nr:response regulator [Acidimicrobiia bacterium]
MTILVAADGTWIREQVRASLVSPGETVIEVTRGQDVRAAVQAHAPDLVILDLQIANMGGIATAIDLHLEASAGRVPATLILLLLDREHDRFLAKRADADAVLVKPFDPGTLRRAVKRLLGAPGAIPARSGP